MAVPLMTVVEVDSTYGWIVVSRVLTPSICRFLSIDIEVTEAVIAVSEDVDEGSEVVDGARVVVDA